MPPPVRGRGCDAPGRRGGPGRRTALDQAHQLQPALQSELAPTVLHVRPPSAGLSSQTAPSVGGRTPSYPFSKSVGSSSRAQPGGAYTETETEREDGDGGGPRNVSLPRVGSSLRTPNHPPRWRETRAAQPR